MHEPHEDTSSSDMTNEMKNIFDEARGASLSESERISMRNGLQLFMAEHPALAPLWIRAADLFSDTYERVAGMRFVPARGLATSAFAFVLVVGVGTSYAAEGALPGDALYAVKIYLNESVTGTFARSEGAQAEWNTALVTRRLEEAEQLALTGKLTSEVRAEIQSAIAVRTADFNTNVAKLAQADELTQVAEVQSNLEATLSGHQEVLAVLAAEKDSPIGAILATVTEHKDAAASERASAEARVVASSDRVKVAAQNSQKNTRQTIKNASAKIAASRSETSATLSARTSLKVAANAAAEGEAQLQAGEYGKAFKKLQAAARTAESAEVHADADVRLNSYFSAFMPPMPQPTTTVATSTATTTPATSTPPTSAREISQ